MATTFEIEGLKALNEQLLELGAVAGQKVLAKASRKAMIQVRDDAKGMVPVSHVHQAHLRDSIKIKTTKPKSGDVVVSTGLVCTKFKIAGEIEVADDLSLDIQVTADAGWRWHFVELGTSHQAAHPFLRPAFAQNIAHMTNTIKEEINSSIQKAIKKQLANET